MATAKKAATTIKSTGSNETTVTRKAVVKKKAVMRPAVKKAAVKKPVTKKKAPVVRKKSPAVKRQAPAVKKKASTRSSSPSVSVTRELKAGLAALKKEIRELKNDLNDKKKRKAAIANTASKRDAAVARFLDSWDKKTHAAIEKAKNAGIGKKKNKPGKNKASPVPTFFFSMNSSVSSIRWIFQAVQLSKLSELKSTGRIAASTFLEGCVFQSDISDSTYLTPSSLSLSRK